MRFRRPVAIAAAKRVEPALAAFTLPFHANPKQMIAPRLARHHKRWGPSRIRLRLSQHSGGRCPAGADA